MAAKSTFWTLPATRKGSGDVAALFTAAAALFFSAFGPRSAKPELFTLGVFAVLLGFLSTLIYGRREVRSLKESVYAALMGVVSLYKIGLVLFLIALPFSAACLGCYAVPLSLAYYGALFAPLIVGCASVGAFLAHGILRTLHKNGVRPVRETQSATDKEGANDSP